ncbi:MAG: hypothetical protein NVS3B14_08640 [Ktedonobacteraceae bacterium]
MDGLDAVSKTFYLVTHFPQQLTYFRVEQNVRLREIPSDMPLRKSHMLCLKVQRNVPDLLTVSLQPFFSQLSAVGSVALSNRVAGCSIDLACY